MGTIKRSFNKDAVSVVSFVNKGGKKVELKLNKGDLELYINGRYKNTMLNSASDIDMSFLEDVDLSGVSTGSVLKYNATTQEWKVYNIDNALATKLDKSSVKTVTGTSATDTISQKLFTDTVTALQTDSLGTLLATDAAPTPGVSGKYTYTSAGYPSYLSGQYVYIGDQLQVTYTAPSTYAYSYIGVAGVYSATHPEIPFQQRWLADTGTQFDVDLAMQAFEKMKAADASTVYTFMPHMASKIRTSGLNRYMAKMYSAKSSTYDAAQATEATQPFATVNAAPNSKVGLKYVQGQTQTGLLDHADVTFAAGDSFTLTMRVKINSKGAIRIYFGASSVVIGSSEVRLNTGIGSILIGAYNFECGKTYTLEFQYSNGAGLIKINNTPIATNTTGIAITFSEITYNMAIPFDGTLYYDHLQNTRKSEFQSQLDHAMLSTFFPEVEGIGIGNQWWTTSNYEGVVAGDGTVIPEVQGNTTDGNAELITNAADREFSSDTGWWTKKGDTTIGSGVATFTGLGSLATSSTYRNLSRDGVLPGVRSYRVKVHARLISGSGVLRCSVGYSERTAAITGISTEYTFWLYSIYSASVDTPICFGGDAGSVYEIDNVSIKEVGASDSTLVYNYVYAATSGTAAVKDLAATKVAAMWCNYDNLATNGAIYGKLSNGYSAWLFNLYTPMRGYRLCSSADFTQLSTYAGGNTVSGKKLKAVFAAWTANTGTNESGFSALPAGYRGTDGTFTGVNTISRFWTSDGYLAEIVDGADTVTFYSGADKRIFASLRFIRNSPNIATDTVEKTTGYITNNIQATPYDMTGMIGGTIVQKFRVLSETAITNLTAVLYTGAGVAKETLFTGVNIDAGVKAEIPVSVRQSIQDTDYTIRFSCTTKTDTAARMMFNVLLENGYSNTML